MYIATLPHPSLPARLESTRRHVSNERTFWNRWVTDRGPLELLRYIDIDIEFGRWNSRRDAFLDYSGWALRNISAHDHQLRWTVRWLAQCLLDQAEEQERFSRTGIAG